MATTVAATTTGAGPETPAQHEDLDTATPPAPGSGPAPARRWYGDGLALLVAGGLGLIGARPLYDNSFLTHLAIGRVLLDSGLPRSNPFLYSSTDFPVPSWWWSGVLALVDRAAGGAGLRLLTMVLAAALGALIVRLTRPVDGSSPGLLSVVLPAVCAFVTLMPFLNPRPQLPGYLLLGVTVLVVRERRSPWWLVPVFATWVNVHGTWMYGLVVLGLVVVASMIDERRLEWRRLLLGATAALGVLVGGVWYPERFRLVGLPFEQFGDERARKALSAYEEWAPSGWGHPLTWMLVAMGLVAVFGAVRRRAWGALAGSVGLVALGLSAGRLLPLAAIALVPWVAVGFAGIGGLAVPRGRAAAATASVGAALLVVAAVWAVSPPAYQLTKYPVAAVNWLDGRGLVARPDVKVASHDYVGNYLEWRFGPGTNTYIDDRGGTDAVLDYTALLRRTSGWRQALRRADPDVIVWADDEPLVRSLRRDPAWYRAGDFDGFTVFCRSSIADRCR